MDFKQLLQKIDSLGGRQQLNEGSKEDMDYYFGKDKKSDGSSKERETGTGHIAKKTDKGTQYTKKDLPGQDTSKDADTKAAEKKAKKKASEDISDMLKSLTAIAEGKKEVDEEKTEEGNEFSGELAKAKAAGKEEFEVDGKKYKVKESKDANDEKSTDDDLDESEDEDKEEISEAELKEKAAPGQEDWIKSNKEKFIKQYGKKKGMEVLYATSWKRSKKKDESKNLEECYDQAMMGGQSEQESGMNINASTDTRTGSKSLTVTAQGEAAEQLAQLLKLSGIGGAHTSGREAEMEEAYVNTPEPEIQGMEVQMSQGTDLNRPKNSFPKVSGGDNPMNMREAQELAALEKQLTEALAEFKISRGVAEAAKWRDPKYKDKLYTQEPGDSDDYDNIGYGYDFPERPENDPGQKRRMGGVGSEFDRNDPLVKGQGIGRSGIKHSLNLAGKRKGLPSRDQITSLKGSIKDAHGKHRKPNLPEQGVAEAKKGSKPDFLDMDKDGDRKEPMKKALADKGKSKEKK